MPVISYDGPTIINLIACGSLFPLQGTRSVSPEYPPVGCRFKVKEEIDSDDFKILKKECNDELKKLEGLLSEVPARSQSLKTIEGLLDTVIEKFTNIDERYAKAELPEKRKIIGSMYVEKISFDDVKHRTAKVSEPLDLILLINNKLKDKKNGKFH